jgi:hypothetical protein
VHWLVKPSRQLGDLRPSGAGVRQGNRLLRRNDSAILQHFEIVYTQGCPSAGPRWVEPNNNLKWQLRGRFARRQKALRNQDCGQMKVLL